MKKNLRFLLALAIGWLTSTGAFALEQVDGVYQIGSAQDFKEFAAVVNSDGRQHKLNAVVTQDFTLDETVMVGAPNNAYSGTFDGQGHTVTIKFTMETGGQDGECGLFRRINGATIKNLKVAGSITTKGQLAGGVVSGIWQTAVVENCVSTVTITDTQSGDGTHGGIVARVSDKGGANAIIIRNCAFLGKIDASGRTGSGGILGWPDNAGGGQVVIENCLMAGTLNLATNQDNDVIVRNSATVTNCYYVALQGMNNSKNATLATAEQLASGEICFKLNGSQSDNPVWFQTIGTDAMPQLMGSGVVYANGSLKCDGTPKGDVTYSNTAGESQRDDHDWNDWGFCTVCDEIQPDFLTADENGFYPIATKQDYNWFMMMVNSKGQPNINGKLTQDLDLSDYTFIPIGVDGRNYAGTFDGQGHRIKNMTIDGTKKEQGFFSTCQGGAVIKNLIIDSSCKMVGTGGGNVAALIGCVNHNNYNNDVILIQNVGNEMSFNCSTTNNAGFIARDFSSFLKVKIENCYNTGNIMGGNENGAFTAWTPRVTLTNCWNTGRIEKTGNYDGSKSLARGNQPQFINSYDLNSENTDNAGAPEGYTAEWLASGKMAYLLNGNKSTDVAWYQVIGTDAYPYPFGTAVVYANGDLKCDGMTPKEGSELTFSNTEGSNVDAHQFNDWGFCSVCDALQPDFMTPNGNGQFELGSDKQLNWFAHYATKVNAAANAVLNANIDMKDVNGFPGIGSPTSKYTGTFDGQKHVISHLTIDNQSTGNPAGFFNNVSAGAVIKNFTLDNSCYIVGHHFVGAFVGQTDGNGTVLLQQLGNEADVAAWEQNAGAIVGCNTSGNLKLTLENCYNTGAISSARESGALSGWLNNAKVTNCYNMGSVQGENSESFARGNSIQTTNCFNVDAWKDLPATPIEDFTNGTVLAKLQEAAPYIWYSSAEEDGHPVLYVTEWGAQKLSDYAGVEVQEGEEFYLYNVESGLWLQENNRFVADWNTHGELGTYGFDVQLIQLADGWQINPKFGHNESVNGSNQYLDTGDGVTAWTFEPIVTDGTSVAYRIKSGDRFLRAGNNDKLECNTNDSRNTWQIVTRQQRLDYAKTGTKANPKDVSFLIRGNEFSHEDTRRHANWTLSDNDNGGQGWEAGRFDENRQNSVFEAWDMTKMNFSQTISNLPAGFYELEARASESPTGNSGVSRALLDQYNAGTLEQYGVLFANDVTAKLPSIYSEQYTERTGHFAARDLNGIWMIDGVNQFSYAVANKESAYKVVTAPVEVAEGGSINLGIKVTDAPNKSVWVMADKFRLRYLGTSLEVTIDEYLAVLNEAIKKAEDFDASTTTDALAAALATAIADAKTARTATTVAEMEAAVQTLNNALSDAEGVNVVILKKTIALAEGEGIDVTAANSAVTEATTLGPVNNALNALRVARRLEAAEKQENVFSGHTYTEGDFYLYNVGAQRFLCGGDDWGAHAAVGFPGQLISLIADGESFKINSHLPNGNGSDWLGYNGYMDTNSQALWTLQQVSDGVYTIARTENTAQLLGYDPTTYNVVHSDRSGTNLPENQWILVSEADRDALIDNASETTPVDVSYKIQSPGFNQRAAIDKWLMTEFNIFGRGGNHTDFACEAWDKESCDINQTVEGLTPGKYEVSVQGYFRDGNGDKQNELVVAGETPAQLATLYAGDEEALLPNIVSEKDKAPGLATVYEIGEYPDGCDAACSFFQLGLYKTALVVEVGSEGTLKMGVKKDNRNFAQDWVVIDNFRLRYLGNNVPVSISETKTDVQNSTTIYNLNGQKVEKARKGLYIINGNKVVIK